MPSIEEEYEGIVEHMQRAMESECYRCGGTAKLTEFVDVRRVCRPCGGTGKRTLGGDQHECELCLGHGEYTIPEPTTVLCDCDGGVRRVGRHDPHVVTAVLNACISGMYTAREAARFDVTNRILDWAMGYCTAAAREALKRAEMEPELADAVVERFRKAGSPDPVELGTKLVGGALTPEELESLLKEDEKP